MVFQPKAAEPEEEKLTARPSLDACAGWGCAGLSLHQPGLRWPCQELPQRGQVAPLLGQQWAILNHYCRYFCSESSKFLFPAFWVSAFSQ